MINLQIFQRSQEFFAISIHVFNRFKPFTTNLKLGGGKRIRTADLPRAKRTLYQLSYTPLNIRCLCVAPPTWPNNWWA